MKNQVMAFEFFFAIVSRLARKCSIKQMCSSRPAYSCQWCFCQIDVAWRHL